ncbi:hypothetical protein FDJ06_gp038 [Pseudomonas phage SL2]|uniref:Uncharacterized protein n=1 Tax=Pseudomonas phage SL2 TaxID=2041345 RepID=A0A2D1GQK7_9CAUD|nr:hypothetical protein FDJ06_gp038 [Pseudomonas phage SL2]ATN94615.1 hypothetical protein SL2_038 [Pseudomonas phage SL2]
MYHISTVYLGDYVLLRPYIPNNRADGEDSVTNRICVAPSVIECIAAKSGSYDIDLNLLGSKSTIYAYRSNSTDYIVGNVPDQKQYREHWYLKPTLFTYVGSLRLLETGVIKVSSEVDMHSKLMVSHRLNYFNNIISKEELIHHWHIEALSILNG